MSAPLRAGVAALLRSHEPLLARCAASTSSPLEHKDAAVTVLIDGGIESAVLLNYWKHWSHGQDVKPLWIDYGQENGKQEHLAAARLASAADLKLDTINVESLKHLIRQEMDPTTQEAQERIPHRSLLLLTLAASHATQNKCSHVAIGLNREDVLSTFTPSGNFLAAAYDLLQSLTPALTLLTPLRQLSKVQVVELGQRHSVDWELTYSCLQGGDHHCGRCWQCRQRRTAFRAAGVAEPASWYQGG